MSRYAGEDLVSMAAIVTGGVVSLIVTLGSLWLGGRQAVVTECADVTQLTIQDMISPTGECEDDWTWPTAMPEPASSAEHWSDPRGPDRGPTDLEWHAISTYETIESMTADQPRLYEVDLALEDLHSLAIEHPGNPYIQELYLKALRVAEYYAAVNNDDVRATILDARFWVHARAHYEYSGVVHEAMRLIVQQLDRDCSAPMEQVALLRDLESRFPYDGPLGETMRAGMAAANAPECALGG